MGGCYEDDSNRSKLSKLLLFMTTKSEGKEINLDKYLDRMQESQESIYYMSGESMDTMKKAPSLQVFKKKDIEVLMLADHLDEPCIQKLADYEGKKFVSIQKADVKLDETEEEKMAEGSEKHEFQAEVNRLMDIIINSLYTDKQVFLRELISNAADALEKARFHSVQDDSFLGDTKDLEVKIEMDPDGKTLSIQDSGIGMS